MAAIRITAPDLFIITSALEEAEKTWEYPRSQVARKLREDITQRYIFAIKNDWKDSISMRGNAGDTITDYGRLEAEQ